MKITNKRLVSILLCLAMVLAVLPVAAFATGTTTLYCAAPDTWTNANVYWWGSAGTNPSWPGEAMTLGSDGLWYYAVPSDATNVIFNNGSVQTSNLDMPADDNVQYNYEAGSWSTYGAEVEVPETVYYLRGTMNNWEATDALTNNGDGTYSITLDLAAGTYEYKAAVADWSWSCPADANASLTLEADDSVTFTLDLAANTVVATAGSIAEPDPMVIDSVIAVGAGSGNFLYGIEWDPAASLNAMENTDGVYTVTYMGVAAGTYEYKFAANGVWSISWGAGCETVSGETYDAYLNGNNNTLNVAVDNSTVTLTLDLSGMDYVTGEGAKCSVEVVEPAVSSAPEAMILGDNAFEIVDGDTNALTSTFTATEAGVLIVNVSAMSTFDAYEQVWSDVPEAYIPMQFGRMYAIQVNGEQVWLPAEVQVEAGDVVTIGVQSYMGNAAKMTVNLSTRELGSKDVKWQLKGDATPNDEAVDLRLISYMESLNYSSVAFNVTINGVTQTLPCTKVYESINANGTPVAAGELFDYANYLVTYIIEGVPASAFDSEIEVTVTWTDLEGNETTSTETRTIVISDNWA